MISTRKPNNVFVLKDSSCCEVTALHKEADDHCTQYVYEVCRRVEIYFLNPRDSRLIGRYKAQLRNVCMKVLLEARLDKRAIMIEDGNQGENAIFLEMLNACFCKLLILLNNMNYYCNYRIRRLLSTLRWPVC